MRASATPKLSRSEIPGAPHSLAEKEYNSKHGNDDAHQVILEIFKIMDLKPPRDRQRIVNKQRIEPQADDIGNDGDQKHINRLNHPNGECFTDFWRYRAPLGNVDHNVGHNDRFVEDQRDRGEERTKNREQHNIAAGG
jgi:hypothetical protein